MTKREYVDKLLAIIDSVERPDELVPAYKGGPGCLVERMHSDKLTECGEYSACRDSIGMPASKVYSPSDDFARGRIDKPTLRTRIAALGEDEA